MASKQPDRGSRVSEQGYDEPSPAGGTSRRQFLTYLIATPTLAIAAKYGLAEGVANAVIPTQPQSADNFDLGDFLILAGKSTEDKLIIIEVDKAGKVHCALPREEVGQGITTAVAMLIAEEMDVPLANVTVTLAPARPELQYNQLTGGSNTIRSVYGPTRTAAAAAKARLIAAAADRTGVPRSALQIRGGVAVGGGHSIPIGELTEAAASPRLAGVTVAVKDPSAFTLVGKPTNRKDAPAMVTRQLKTTTDP